MKPFLSDKTLIVWSLAESRVVTKLRGNGHAATCMVLTRPVMMVGGGDGEVHVWHVRRAELMFRLNTCQAWISCLSFRDDAVVAGDVRGNLIKWSLSNNDTNMVSPMIITKMTDAVRGVYLDQFNLVTLSFDGDCDVYDIW